MTDFDMNSFQNVFSACVDEQLLESGWKIGTKREDPKISAQRLKLEPLDALKFAQQTVEGAFLQSKTTYEVSLALLDQTVKWRMFMIS